MALKKLSFRAKHRTKCLSNRREVPINLKLIPKIVRIRLTVLALQEEAKAVLTAAEKRKPQQTQIHTKNQLIWFKQASLKLLLNNRANS